MAHWIATLPEDLVDSLLGAAWALHEEYERVQPDDRGERLGYWWAQLSRAMDTVPPWHRLVPDGHWCFFCALYGQPASPFDCSEYHEEMRDAGEPV